MSSVQALAGVPQGIVAMRDLLRQPRVDQEKVNEKLASITACLSAYAGAGAWLAEAKDLHDRLTRIDGTLRRMFDKIAEARTGRDAVFAAADFELAPIRDHWEFSQQFRLALRVLAEKVQHISVPLVLGTSAQPVDGPPWYIDFYRYEKEIDEVFRELDVRGEVGIDGRRALYSAAGRAGLQGALLDHLARANELIRDLASLQAQALQRLSSALDGI